jgi:hypothetical protein
MAQLKQYSFGVDNVSFIDAEYNVYSIEDPQNFELNLTYEKAEHRGGTNNDIRDVRIHSRSGEITLSTGVVDEKFAKILTGGTITSLGTSDASVTTGVSTLYGDTDTILTGITSVNIIDDTLVRTDDYYITALAANRVKVTRVSDGKDVQDDLTLTASTTVACDSDRGVILTTGSGAVSLTAGEKAYFTTRKAITSGYQSISFDDSKPDKISLRATVKENGTERQINCPVVQATGGIEGMSASEFKVKDLSLGLEVSALGELSNMITVK